jgi:hypothetical protein
MDAMDDTKKAGSGLAGRDQTEWGGNMGWRDEAVRNGIYMDGMDDAYEMETRSGLAGWKY